MSEIVGGQIYRKGWIAGLIDARGIVQNELDSGTSAETWRHFDVVVHQINILVKILEDLQDMDQSGDEELRVALARARSELREEKEAHERLGRDYRAVVAALDKMFVENDKLEATLREDEDG